ncbi:MAG: hypothetical protein ACM3ZQ_09430 [Bacillota bacterium]
MSVRPVDLQVAVPKMAEADRLQKTLEQPQHDQTFANEVKQLMSKKEREVQRQDDVQHAAVHREGRESRGKDPGKREDRRDGKKGNPEDRTQAVSDGLRGRKLDVRV